MSPYSWHAHPEAAIAIALLVTLYVAGAERHRPTRARALAFAASQILLFVVFMTPVETISLHFLLSVHLLQNVVAAEWAPALAVFGLAPALARRLERHAVVRLLTHPLVALPLWIATYFAWHVPWLYDLALNHQNSIIHVEHACYFFAGCLVWWPVVHGRWPDGVKALYLFGAFVLASPLGLLLALLPRPVYSFYVHSPRLWGLSHLADQQLAGLTMAAEQAVVFFAVFAVYVSRFFRSESIAGTYRVRDNAAGKHA